MLAGHRYATVGLPSADGLFLDFLNGFFVALSAMGAHSLARDKLGWK